MRIPLIAGRTFSAADTSNSTPVIIISESLAQKMFPHQNPLGKRIRSWRDEHKYWEIVGVISNIRYFGLAEEPSRLLYVPTPRIVGGP